MIEVTTTGAPQGCVSSPFIFTLYTNDCVPSLPINTLVKFSDDSALVCLITISCDVKQYFSEITNLVKWCDENNLLLNVKKTKEIAVDPPGICEHSPVHIQGEEIERVSNFRYLGVHVDDTLNWSVHVDAVCAQGPASHVFPSSTQILLCQ